MVIGDFISILKFTGFAKISPMSFFSLILPEYLWVLSIHICTSVYQQGNIFFYFIFPYCLGSYYASFSSEHLQFSGPLNHIDFVLLPFLKFSSVLIEFSFTLSIITSTAKFYFALLNYFYMSSLAYLSHAFVNLPFSHLNLFFVLIPVSYILSFALANKKEV